MTTKELRDRIFIALTNPDAIRQMKANSVDVIVGEEGAIGIELQDGTLFVLEVQPS